jgi:filamentous hemagglutinin
MEEDLFVDVGRVGAPNNINSSGVQDVSSGCTTTHTGGSGCTNTHNTDASACGSVGDAHSNSSALHGDACMDVEGEGASAAPAVAAEPTSTPAGGAVAPGGVVDAAGGVSAAVPEPVLSSAAAVVAAAGVAGDKAPAALFPVFMRGAASGTAAPAPKAKRPSARAAGAGAGAGGVSKTAGAAKQSKLASAATTKH